MILAQPPTIERRGTRICLFQLNYARVRIVPAHVRESLFPTRKLEADAPKFPTPI